MITSRERGNKGFTLVELLLYTSISAAMLTVIVTFLFVLMQSRIKNQTIAEVEQQGAHVLQIMTQSVRNAEGIVIPASGNAASVLQVDVLEASNDPTTFDAVSGSMRMTEGAGDPISLTSPLVTVTDLQFENLSRQGTPGTVRITFTVSRANVDGKSEYNYSKTFYGSTNIRR